MMRRIIALAASLWLGATPALADFSGPSTGSNGGGPNPTNIIIFGPLAKVNSAVVFGTGGTGYVTGDTIPVAGGTCSIQPVLTVTAPSGAVTALSVATPGSCTVLPPNNPATQASTSGAGTGATFVLTWAAIAQTYTPTSGMKAVRFCELGPGAGGGAGALQAASAAASGGGGGGGGALFFGTFTAAQIGAGVSVQVGIGGNGGIPPTTTLNGGNGFQPSAATNVGPTLLAVPLPGAGAGAQLGAVTSGGGAGAGFVAGANSTGAAGGVGGGGAPSGGAGAAGGTTANLYAGASGAGSSAAGVGSVGGSAAGGGPGGGSGGGFTSGSGTNIGGNGGANDANGTVLAGGFGTSTNGQNGLNQSVPTCEAMAGSGPGGGGSSTTGNGGNGGNGGLGAGGAGGGDAQNGVGLPGFGGRGGDGGIEAIELF